ncbi:MAG: molybdate ABC transporter substrate-binding protein [Deltaproteobacteria bacterium]|nr:molybdate ABC transporter substrate-binding protein [Deltaproteobacteria bacterium]
MRLGRDERGDGVRPLFDEVRGRRRFRRGAWMALGLALLGACVGATMATMASAALRNPTRSDSDPVVVAEAMSDAERAGAKVTLTVFAASSLAEAFDTLARSFEAAHPEITVRTVFSGSQILRLQIEQGAAADVFASAHEAHLESLIRAKAMTNAMPFAENDLVVIVPRTRGHDAGTAMRFEDLDEVGRIVIGSENVPVGVYTRLLLRRAEAYLGADFVAGVRSRVVSEESNVRLIRAKVELGEADAAFVYRTDALGSKAVEAIEIPPDINVRTRYFIGVTARANPSDAAGDFVDYVCSPEGQRILVRQGFGGIRL